MRDESRSRASVCRALALALTVLFASHAMAQESPNTTSSPPTANPAKENAEKPKARKKPRGRLPTYYAKVVSQKQRSEIYDIQGKYDAKIDELQQQLKLLVTQRDKEVEAVLTPEQRKEVAGMHRERSQRRKSKKAAAS